MLYIYSITLIIHRYQNRPMVIYTQVQFFSNGPSTRYETSDHPSHCLSIHTSRLCSCRICYVTPLWVKLIIALYNFSLTLKSKPFIKQYFTLEWVYQVRMANLRPVNLSYWPLIGFSPFTIWDYQCTYRSSPISSSANYAVKICHLIRFLNLKIVLLADLFWHLVAELLSSLVGL